MKIVFSILLALAINFLLFLFIQKLVLPEHKALVAVDPIEMVDFIRFKEEKKVVEPKQREELPDKPPPPKKPPPPPPMEQVEAEKPPLQELQMPTPRVDLPLSISGGPHLGGFYKNAPAPPKPAPVAAPEPKKLGLNENVIPTYRSSPKYPSRAMRAGIEGVVTVEFTITAKGTVKEPVIVKADPPKIFNKAVLRAIKKWKFKPHVINGTAVDRRARQDITFTLNNR